ncbi:hypothetical protein PHLGIDRAFT_510983, partial [Phlebiopsis gigantea 11061_1 CR5-6]
IQMSNDRPNVYLAVRRIRHALTSYRDLADLLVSPNRPPGYKIPKFLVFFDSKREAIAAADALRERLPPEFKTKVVWFNSDNSPEFREQTTEDLAAGGYYGLMCTDAFGMGVDLADIELVIQWRCSCDLDTLWQRFGRAARDPRREGLAVLFAESKHFDSWKAEQAKRRKTRAHQGAEKAIEKE